MIMILVFIMMLLQLMKYETYTSIQWKRMAWYKMFGFIKKVFVVGVIYFSFNVLSVNSLECISMKNQECKVRKEAIYINTNNPVFYPFSVKVNKCSGNCNNISDPYARLCVPDVVKNINLKVLNLVLWSNQTKQIKVVSGLKVVSASVD